MTRLLAPLLSLALSCSDSSRVHTDSLCTLACVARIEAGCLSVGLEQCRLGCTRFERDEVQCRTEFETMLACEATSTFLCLGDDRSRSLDCEEQTRDFNECEGARP